MFDPTAFQSTVPITLRQDGCWVHSQISTVPSVAQKVHVLTPTMRTNFPLPYDSRFARGDRNSRRNSRSDPRVNENWDKWTGSTDTTSARDPNAAEADSVVKDVENVAVREDPDTSEAYAPAVEEANMPSTVSETSSPESQTNRGNESENEINSANNFLETTVRHSVETDAIKTTALNANDNMGTSVDDTRETDMNDTIEPDATTTAIADENDTTETNVKDTDENHTDVNSSKDSSVESRFAVVSAASQSIKAAMKESSSDVNVVLDGGDNRGRKDQGGGSGGDNGGGNEGGNDGEGERDELKRMLRLSDTESQKASLEDLQSLHRATRVPLLGALALRWPALRNRLAANRRFPLQMGVEITVGLITKTLAELQGRGENFWKEFDFYLSDIALEVFGDAILVWLLSPVAIMSGAHPGILQRLPKHFGQIGAYSTPMRVGGFLYKALQFGAAGFLSSVAGHSLTRWLVARRDANRRKSGGSGSNKSVELAPVLPTSLAWGGFLMTSSNARYQLVNGFEQRVLDPMFGGNAALLTILTFALRFGNCYVGGLQWLPWAKMWDIQ